jgi:hypothetical protein
LEGGADLIMDEDGLSLVLIALESHATPNSAIVSELIPAAFTGLCNLAVASDNARSELLDIGGIKTMCSIIEYFKTDKSIASIAHSTYATMAACDDDLSKDITEYGMHELMASIERFGSDADFVASALAAITALAFVQENLASLVQYNGIQKIISSIIEHPDNVALITKAIATLEAIAMASGEYAAVVVEVGGRELINTILAQENMENETSIQSAGKAALLALATAQNIAKSDDVLASVARKTDLLALGPKRGEVVGKEDPIADVRHLLSAGKILKIWIKGSPTTYHVLVSPDFRAILWQDVSSQRKMGALDLRLVKTVTLGPGIYHKGGIFATKIKDPEACICLNAERDENGLYLECSTTKDAKVWYHALSRLIHAFRTSPDLL